MGVAAQMRQTGWIVILVIAIALFVTLTFRVNAARGEVRSLERQIVAIEREKLLLETEFESRASQQQLANWNAVEFGYVPPRGDQYLDNRAQLAALGLPRADGAPTPIRLARAHAQAEEHGSLVHLVSAFDMLPVEEGRTGLKSAGTLLDISFPDGERVENLPHRDAREIAQRLSGSVRLSGTLARSGE